MVLAFLGRRHGFVLIATFWPLIPLTNLSDSSCWDGALSQSSCCGSCHRQLSVKGSAMVIGEGKTIMIRCQRSRIRRRLKLNARSQSHEDEGVRFSACLLGSRLHFNLLPVSPHIDAKPVNCCSPALTKHSKQVAEHKLI